jgi:hypothetical protein
MPPYREISRMRGGIRRPKETATVREMGKSGVHLVKVSRG